MPDERGRFVKGEHWRPHRPFREREYLEREYVEKGRAATEIASEFGVHENAIYFWLAKHGIPRRSIRAIRQVKKWGARGAANGMYGRRGAEVASWRGGVTPERQALYSTPEWEAAVLMVRKRDGGRCQRCGAWPRSRAEKVGFFTIHHLVSFAVRELRCEPTNLVQLCQTCHRFVHSRKNTAREFIRERGAVA